MKEKHETKLREKIFDAYGKSWKDEDIEKKTDDIASSVKFCCQNADLVSTITNIIVKTCFLIWSVS